MANTGAIRLLLGSPARPGLWVRYFFRCPISKRLSHSHRSRAFSVNSPHDRLQPPGEAIPITSLRPESYR